MGLDTGMRYNSSFGHHSESSTRRPELQLPTGSGTRRESRLRASFRKAIGSPDWTPAPGPGTAASVDQIRQKRSIE